MGIVRLLLFALTLSLELQAGESSVYDFSWLDPDKEVFVLQNRKFLKARKLHASAGFGMTTSGPFVDATAVQGRLAFFPFEEWGIEGLYSRNKGVENDNAKLVRKSGKGPGSTPFRRIVKRYQGGMLLWSPFYAKINTFNKIVYLDWMFGLGIAQLTEENNKTEYSTHGDKKDPSLESHQGILWQLTFNVFVTQVANLRFDFVAVHFEADSPSESVEDTWNHHYDLILSMGIRL